MFYRLFVFAIVDLYVSVSEDVIYVGVCVCVYV